MGPWVLLLLGVARGAPDDGACPGCRVDDTDGWHLEGGQILGPSGVALRFEGEADPSGPLTAENVNTERGRLAAELEARGLKLGEAGGRIVTTALGEPTVVIEGEVVKTRSFDRLSPGQTPPRNIARITRRCVGAIRVSAEGDEVDAALLTRAASQVLWADPSCERYNPRPFHRVSAASAAATTEADLLPPPPPPRERAPLWPWALGVLGIAGVGAAAWWRQRGTAVVTRSVSPPSPAANAPFRPRESAGPAPEIQSIGWGAGPVFRPGEAAAPPPSPPPPEPQPEPPPGPEPMLELKPIPFAGPPRSSAFGFAPAPPEPDMLPDPSGPVFLPNPTPAASETANADPMVAAVAALGQQLGLDRAPPSAGEAMKVPAPYAAFLESCDGASWGSGWLRLLGVREGRGISVYALNAGLSGRIGRRFALGFFGDGGLVALTPRGEVVVGFPDGRPPRSMAPNLTTFLVGLGRDAALRASLCDPAALIRVQRMLGPLGPDQVFDWGVEPPRKVSILARWKGASLL